MAFPCMQSKTIFFLSQEIEVGCVALHWSLAVVLRGPLQLLLLTPHSLPGESYSPKGLLFLYRLSSQDSSWSVPCELSPVSSTL